MYCHLAAAIQDSIMSVEFRNEKIFVCVHSEIKENVNRYVTDWKTSKTKMELLTRPYKELVQINKTMVGNQLKHAAPASSLSALCDHHSEHGHRSASCWWSMPHFYDTKVWKCSTPEEIKKRMKAVIFCLSVDKKRLIVEGGKEILV